METVSGLETLGDVIRCLRETGRYTDDEGEATDHLDQLASMLAAPPAAAAPSLLMLTTLRDVVRCLRETGSYSDEEGEVTDQLDRLATMLAASPAAAAGVPTDDDLNLSDMQPKGGLYQLGAEPPPSVRVLVARVEAYGRSCAVDAYKSAADRLEAVRWYAEKLATHAYAEGRKDQSEATGEAWQYRTKNPNTGELSPWFPCSAKGAERARASGYEVRAASPVAPVGAPTRQHSVHLAAMPIDQDFRRRPASSKAAPSAEGSE